MSRAPDERPPRRASDPSGRRVQLPTDPRHVVALFLWLAIVLLAAHRAHAAVVAPSTLAALFALAFVPYAPLALARRDLPFPLLLALSLGVGVLFALAPVALSDDLFRFLWDARVAAHGLDPYAYAPSDPALAALRDVHHANVNHPDIPTIYPPGAQLLFLVAELLGHHPRSPRLLALAGHLAVGFVLRRRGPSGSATAWLLNPLALSESALGGHVDVFVGLAILASALAFARHRLRAIVFALAALAVKLVGALLLPLALRDRRALALGLLLAMALVFPLTRAGYASETVGGFGHYARRWGGNAGLHLALERSLHTILATFEHEPGRLRLDFARPLLLRVEGTALDPHASFTPEKKPLHDVAFFETHVASALLARALAALFVCSLALFLGRRVARGSVDPAEAARLAVLAALLLAPQIHPWYLLWLLPLELALGREALLLWSALALGAYAPLDLWWTERLWVEPLGFGVLQHLVVLGVLVAERNTHETSGRMLPYTDELSPTRV
jgi:hypothetical protein